MIANASHIFPQIYFLRYLATSGALLQAEFHALVRESRIGGAAFIWTRRRCLSSERVNLQNQEALPGAPEKRFCIHWRMRIYYGRRRYSPNEVPPLPLSPADIFM